MARAETKTFQYVKESSGAFLELFPHRYDFIYAAHPEPNKRPEWLSEMRYPLSDRQLLEGKYLYGVRFEKETQYFLLDIDAGSPYHPKRSPLILDRLLASLEPLGITDHIACTSSDSGGLHIYFPIGQSFSSWKLSKAICTTLENAGFKLKLGQLEVFPNPKSYNTSETPSLFNAHRLPLQMGSYVLGAELQPINSSQAYFSRMWQFCQKRNVLDMRCVKRLLKQAKQANCRLSHKASKFLDDLNAEIEVGWTGHGQTNRLLGRIAMRSFVFNHIIEGGAPLVGRVLIEKIVSVAKALPGYKDWCRHQHEIGDRAQEWARSVENSHYFAYGTARGRYKALGDAAQVDSQMDKEPNYNQRRARQTQAKITAAVQDLLAKDALPLRATARFRVLLKYGVGGASLYRYRELWHPIEQPLALNNLVESGCDKKEVEDACTGGANALNLPPSLLLADDGNLPDAKDLSLSRWPLDGDEGSNVLDPVQVIREGIKRQLAEARKRQARPQRPHAVTGTDEPATAIHCRGLQRMREFLLAGEPILITEVGRWLAKQPQAVHDELVAKADETLHELLGDLAQLSLLLVSKGLSSAFVRKHLEQLFDKSLILELSVDERHAWLRSLHLLKLQHNSTWKK